jgi:hypothetical protein
MDSGRAGPSLGAVIRPFRAAEAGKVGQRQKPNRYLLNGEGEGSGAIIELATDIRQRAGGGAGTSFGRQCPAEMRRRVVDAGTIATLGSFAQKLSCILPERRPA